MARPQVHVLALGGTIAMTDDGGGGVTPTLDADALLAAVPALEEVASVTAASFRQVPGAHLSLDDLVALGAEIARRVADGADGVVVTQGTDTIEETAFALDLLVDGDTPVVVTGAMRNPAQPGADGPANLLNAVRIAGSTVARGAGTVVAMDDTIHAARFLRKGHTSRPSAFVSAGAGPIGWVSEERVRVPLHPRRRVHVPVPADASPPRVALVTAALGDPLAWAVDAALDDGAAGVVVAAFGAGHLDADAVDVIGRVAGRVPVVLTSRTGAGEIYRATYGFPGSERDLVDRGVVTAGALDGPKARILLALGLAASWSADQLADAYEQLIG